jgi:hypothetical protein
MPLRNPLLRMQTKWNFYHWSDAEMNGEGKSLKTCMECYGVGGWYSKEKDMVAALIYLSADKTAGSSWLLGIKHLNNKQEVARIYDADPNTYHLSLDTALGGRITSLLASSVFTPPSKKGCSTGSLVAVAVVCVCGVLYQLV